MDATTSPAAASSTGIQVAVAEPEIFMGIPIRAPAKGRLIKMVSCSGGGWWRGREGGSKVVR